MTQLVRHRAVYRWLLWLYPASFRREYGEPMVQVFCDRLRDERALGVWRRTLDDLARSVPKQRIEVFMSEQQQTTLRWIAVIAAVAVSFAAVSTVGIPALALLLALAVWLAYQQRRGRLLRLPGQRTWYRWVLSGGIVIAVEMAAVSISSYDAGTYTWSLLLLLFVLGLLAVVTGIAMGVRDLRQAGRGSTLGIRAE